MGPERRRRWREDEKARIIEESLRLGAQVTDIARCHGISRALRYAWRREARCTPVAPPTPDFVPVLLSAPEEPQSATAATETVAPNRGSRRSAKQRTDGGGEIEVVLPGGARLTLRGRGETTALRRCWPLSRHGRGLEPAEGSWSPPKPIDFRKGIDGLAALVKAHLGADPFSGTVFVFRAKRADRIKLIVWDGTGRRVFAKRLEEGTFHWPKIEDGVMRLTPVQLSA